MPRQPFRNAKIRLYNVGYNSLEARPELAAIVGNCISVWSQTELQLSLCLAAMLGSNTEAAVGVYLSLQNARAQRDALSSAATVSLGAGHLAIFEAVMAMHKSLSGDRNDLAHGIFGFSEDDPNILLWHPSAKHAAWLVSIYNAEAAGAPLTDPHNRLRDEMFFYKKQDLEKIYRDFGQLWEAVFELHSFLRRPEHEPKADILARLCAIPQIRAELDRVGHNSIPSGL